MWETWRLRTAPSFSRAAGRRRIASKRAVPLSVCSDYSFSSSYFHCVPFLTQQSDEGQPSVRTRDLDKGPVVPPTKLTAAHVSYTRLKENDIIVYKQTNKAEITMFTCRCILNFSCFQIWLKMCCLSASLAALTPHPLDNWVESVTLYSGTGPPSTAPNDRASATEQMQPHTCSPTRGSRKTEQSIHTRADNVSPVTAVSLTTAHNNTNTI